MEWKEQISKKWQISHVNHFCIAPVQTGSRSSFKIGIRATSALDHVIGIGYFQNTQNCKLVMMAI